ncbi:MAG TPA: hypothetical protein VG253_05115, partial [Streptosporangiaceae bacterium]|nr:hypothetical protein [Streptosporangiaceae bacterium]
MTQSPATLRTDRLYLGWEYAVVHPDPGAPPRRPVPPGQEQVNPGWVAAQRREEHRLSLPAKFAAGGLLVLALAVGCLGAAGLLNGSLTVAGIAAFLLPAGICVRDIWRGEMDLRARLAAEERRVAKARSAQQSRLFSWQEEHARRFREWQARTRMFRGQLHWYAVDVPADVDRVDVAGGTVAGWSAMMTTMAGLRLAAGGEVTVLDLSEAAVAGDLLAAARGGGIDPLVWVLPADLPRFDLGGGLPGEALADVLAVTAAASAAAVASSGSGGQAGDAGNGMDPSQDHAVLERIVEVTGPEPSIAQITAALRALAQVGDPRDDVRRGLLTAGQLEAVSALYGQGAADRVVIERALTLEARLRKLDPLGSSPVALPRSRLRVVAMDRGAAVAGTATLGTYVTVALTHLLRQWPAGQPWQHTLFVTGAEKLRADVLDRLYDACESTRTGLVMAYRSMPPHVKSRLGRGNAAVAFMRLGNAEDAKAASEQIGTQHRFLVSQLTDTVGTSATDTLGDSYTSTVGTADSVAVSASTSQTVGRSKGRGQTWSGLSAFGPRGGSGHRDRNFSEGTSDSVSITEGINSSSAWGVSTSTALAANSSLARTTQRSREFLVEQHELQQLPPTALIVSYASATGRRVVLADANPAIMGLPTATFRSVEEIRQGPPGAAMAPTAGQAADPDAREHDAREHDAGDHAPREHDAGDHEPGGADAPSGWQGRGTTRPGYGQPAPGGVRDWPGPVPPPARDP